MRLVRIGNQVINLDYVANMDFQRNGNVRLFFSGVRDTHPDHRHVLVLEGSEARAFKEWLEQNLEYGYPGPEEVVEDSLVEFVE
ncbi:MAG: hypothetical protein M3220_02235 [Chloroflexota bacterium]|nr:hypothetical protein [Chloroflexota bacterium]